MKVGMQVIIMSSSDWSKKWSCCRNLCNLNWHFDLTHNIHYICRYCPSKNDSQKNDNILPVAFLLNKTGLYTYPPISSLLLARNTSKADIPQNNEIFLAYKLLVLPSMCRKPNFQYVLELCSLENLESYGRGLHAYFVSFLPMILQEGTIRHYLLWNSVFCNKFGMWHVPS